MSFPAEWYEQEMVPALFAPWAALLMRAADARPGERVLDVACGTGIVARRIAPCVGSQGAVTGLDANPDMLRVAEAAARREDHAIEWRLGQAEMLPFPDGSFDLIVCQFGLMLFRDRHAALAEMHRALRVGGRVALSVWQGLERHPFYQALHDESLRRLGVSGVGQAFSLGDAAELRGLLVEAGFQQVELESASITARFAHPEALLAWELDVDPASAPALQSLDAAARQAIMDTLRQDMQAPLRAALWGDQAVLPFHAHIARARR